MEKALCLGFLNTPPLWVKEQFGITQFEFPQLDITHYSPKPIAPNQRLGHKIEGVCAQLLELSDRYRILVAGLPIKQGKGTLGEIDFIVKDIYLQRVIHIELTYKFYVVNTDITEPIHQLMGPNKSDMFFTKMEKIRQRQFPLLHTHEARVLLAQKGVDSLQLQHRACFKAQLFVPYGNNHVHIRPLNKNCIVGHWMRFDEFNSSSFKHYQFYIPNKMEWVITPHFNVSWTSHFEILMELNLRMLKENAPMLWMKGSDTEIEKFFVVWW